MAVTISATPNPGGRPPNVLLTVTSTTPLTATVMRQYTDGSSAPVRTADGGPVTLAGSGTNYVVVMNDFEAPAGEAVFYSVNGVYSVPVVLEATVPWLVHLGNAIYSVPLDLVAGSFSETRRATARGVFQVAGRDRPLVISTGKRRSPESSFIAATSTAYEAQKMEALIADDSVLFLNVPADLRLGVKTAYISVGDVPETRPSDIGADALRHWTLPYLVVDAPLGGTTWLGGGGGGGPVDPNARTMADLAVEITAAVGHAATMADAAASYATMADAAAGA